MAGYRDADYTARSRQTEFRGIQRTPDLVAKQGTQPIRRVQDGQMKIKQGETLLLYDCELLFQAQDPQGQSYMVSHTSECHGECEYVAVPVDQRSLSEYRAGRIDLRNLMLTGGERPGTPRRAPETPANWPSSARKPRSQNRRNCP